MKKTILKCILIFCIYLLLIYFINDISSSIFRNQKFHFIGNAPFRSDRINEVSNFPENSKAVLKYTDGNLIVYLPYGAEYFTQIIDDINLINYQLSKLENHLVNSFYEVTDKFDLSSIFEYSKKVKYSVTTFFIILFGLTLNPFNKNKYLLFTFFYQKKFIANIIIFSIFSLGAYIIYETRFFIYNDSNLPLFAGISGVFLIGIFNKLIFKSLIILLSISLLYINIIHNYIYYIFIISIILNMIYSFIYIKKYQYINIKEKSIEQEAEEYENRSSNDIN